ncbi:MAG: hypothetical protein COT15_05325, partial [Candidatus Diapherotrites archaeon CG08_land_8_20_14_0_20_34_12]
PLRPRLKNAGSKAWKKVRPVALFPANAWDFFWVGDHRAMKANAQQQIMDHKISHGIDKKGLAKSLETNKEYLKVSARHKKWQDRVDRKDAQIRKLQGKQAEYAARTGAKAKTLKAITAARLALKKVRRWDLAREVKPFQEKKAEMERSTYESYELAKAKLREVAKKIEALQSDSFKSADSARVLSIQSMLNQIRLKLARADRDRLSGEVLALENTIQLYEDALSDLRAKGRRHKSREKIHAKRMERRGSNPEHWEDVFEHGFERLEGRMDSAIRRGGVRVKDATVSGFKRARSVLSRKKKE